MRFSPTFLKTVEQCRLRARWKKIDHAPQEESEASFPLRFGKATHQALETVYKHLVDTGYVGPFDDDIANIAHEAVNKATEENGPFPHNSIENIRWQVIDYLENQEKLNAKDVLGTEQFLNWSLEQGTNVVGYIDRVDRRRPNGVAVIDYKGGKRAWNTDIIRSDVQMQTYAVASAARYPWAERIYTEIHMVTQRKTATALWTKDDLEFVEQELKQRYLDANQQMLDGPWDATPGPHCSTCDFKRLCPAYDGTPAAGTWNPVLGSLQPEQDQ